MSYQGFTTIVTFPHSLILLQFEAELAIFAKVWTICKVSSKCPDKGYGLMSTECLPKVA